MFIEIYDSVLFDPEGVAPSPVIDSINIRPPLGLPFYGCIF